MSFEQKSRVTYKVYGLDVWGHASDECCAGYGCECIVTDDDGHETHDENAECDADFQVNDRCKVGSIEVETDDSVKYNDGSFGYFPSNDAIVKALVAGDYLQDNVTASMVDIDGETDSLLCVDSKATGRPLFQLEYDGIAETS